MDMHTFEDGTEVDLDDPANFAWLLLAIYELKDQQGEEQEQYG